MAGNVYKLVHSSYIITVHKSQRTRITLVKKEAASPQNIVHPFLLKPYAVLGMQQSYSLIHTLQTQQTDQEHSTGVLSPASGTSKHTRGWRWTLGSGASTLIRMVVCILSDEKKAKARGAQQAAV